MELQGFYGHDADSLTGADGVKPSPFLLHAATNKPTTPTLKFHNHFPPDVATWVKIETKLNQFRLSANNFRFNKTCRFNFCFVLSCLFFSVVYIKKY